MKVIDRNYEPPPADWEKQYYGRCDEFICGVATVTVDEYTRPSLAPPPSSAVMMMSRLLGKLKLHRYIHLYVFAYILDF